MTRTLIPCVVALYATTATPVRAETFTCSSAPAHKDCAAVIPDGYSLLTSTMLVVPQDCHQEPILDVDVRLNILHPWTGDITAKLRSPSGKEAWLLYRPQLAAGPYGCPHADVDAIFTDQGTKDITTCEPMIPALGGRVIPFASLKTFQGESRLGTWTLEVTDAARQDVGFLNDWQLIMPCDFSTVTVRATDAIAYKTGTDTATFTISRVGGEAEELVVGYVLGGTATTAHYQPLTGTVTLPVGAVEETVEIVPIDNGLAEPSMTVTLTLIVDGEYDVGTPDEATITLHGRKPTVTLVATPSPSQVGQTVHLQVDITGGPPVATGKVRFQDGDASLGEVDIDANGRAVLDVASLAMGNHALKAIYDGDGTYGPGASTLLSHRVDEATTTMALEATPNPSVLGQEVTLSATVTTTGLTKNDTVRFMDDTTLLGEARVELGRAQLVTRSLTLGSHSLRAEFAGTETAAPAVSTTVTQVVNEPGTTTTLVSSANPSLVGQPVTFTATVTSERGPALGAVSFKDGDVVLGTVPVAGGVASFSSASLSAGTHGITAVFGTVQTAAASTSAVLNQVVNKAAATVALEATPTSIAQGQSIALLATVTSAQGTPAGSVTFKDGTTTLGYGALSDGRATMSFVPSGGGTHSLTAEYGGGTGWNAAVSVAVNVEVQSPSTDEDKGCGCAASNNKTHSTWLGLGLAAAVLKLLRRRRPR